MTDFVKVAKATSDKLDKSQKELEVRKPFTPQQKSTIDELKKLYIRHIELERDYRVEWNLLKQKYFKALRPLYNSREQCLKLKSETDASQTVIPDFWLTALKNHSAISQTIEEHDEQVLKYLENIDYEWFDETEQLSFSVKMIFGENPFFTNRLLVKEFHLENEAETDESVLSKSIGTEIDWIQGKNVMKSMCVRRQRNKRTGQTRVVRQLDDRQSFFHFFDSHVVPDDDKLEVMREREVHALENTLEVEYEMGCILRDKIITHALGWYLGIEIDDDDDALNGEEDSEYYDDDSNNNSVDEQSDEDDDANSPSPIVS